MEFERPEVELKRRAAYAGPKNGGLDIYSRSFAAYMDQCDPLKDFRQEFVVPKNKTLKETNFNVCDPEKDGLYFCGHSLGLRPKRNKKYIDMVLNDWDCLAVAMHFEGKFQAAGCEDTLKQFMAELTGSEEDEVAAMNGLTVNLNLLSLTFYKPTKDRHKIFIEESAFPSDRYAMQALLKFHGYDPEINLIEMKPRKDEHTLRDEDIVEMIETRGHEIALILFPGVQYYTGQFFNIEEITAIGHKHGCIVGIDLAHAIGNKKLRLHDWNVDFAVWCSYKYLCSGAGGIGGAFLHRNNSHIEPALCGWWSNNSKDRFDMNKNLNPSVGIDAFKMSNISPVTVAMAYAGLEVYHEAGMDRIVEKQFLLTGYLELLLNHHQSNAHISYDGNSEKEPFMEIITPKDHQKRGSQLSLTFNNVSTDKINNELMKNGVQLDFRRPNVLRIGALPLYNTFTDVYEFVEILNNIIKNLKN